MKPRIKKQQQITIHRDGTVSYWSIYRQVWDRTSAYNLTTRHDDYAALSDSDRTRISRAARDPDHVHPEMSNP